MLFLRASRFKPRLPDATHLRTVFFGELDQGLTEPLAGGELLERLSSSFRRRDFDYPRQPLLSRHLGRIDAIALAHTRIGCRCQALSLAIRYVTLSKLVRQARWPEMRIARQHGIGAMAAHAHDFLGRKPLLKQPRHRLPEIVPAQSLVHLRDDGERIADGGRSLAFGQPLIPPLGKLPTADI
jgi:hypothetical protein